MNDLIPFLFVLGRGARVQRLSCQRGDGAE